MKKLQLLFAVTLGILGVLAGCQDGKRPMGPAVPYSLKVAIGGLDQVRPSFLGSTQNEILWRLDSPSTFTTGTTGPFSSANAGVTLLELGDPPTEDSVLSVQLNDYPSGKVLAVGAAAVSPYGGNILLQMGSVSRSCYKFDINSPTFAYGMSYGFATGTSTGSAVTGTTSYDVGASLSATNLFYLRDVYQGMNNTIAYLGTGNLVDHDVVPPPASFYANSGLAKVAAALPVTTVQLGDIYCLKLGTIANAHAWIQITNIGSVGSRGPAFVFRVNSSVPYFAYERTSLDVTAGGRCDLLCSGVMGYNVTGVPQNNFGQTTMYFEPVTLFSPVTLAGMSFYQTGSGIGGVPVTFQLGVYDQVGGKPTNLLGSTTVYSTTIPGFVSAPLNSYLTLSAPATYWLGVHAEEFNHNASVSSSYAFYTLPSNTYGSLPAALPGPSVTVQTSPTTYPLVLFGIYCP